MSMLNKILCVIILGAFSTLASVEAQTTPTAPAKIKGRIIAARVEGHVDAIAKVGGQSRALHDKDVLSDGFRIVTASGANVILVFSNGATVNIAADSALDIDEFMQDPFASDLKVSDLKEEPGTSTTKLNLTKGELVGKVVHLNVDKGSEFTVQTPVGAAGIRGTTFRIVFRPGPNGTAFFTVTTADGRILFTGNTSTPVSIPAGKQVVVTFDVESGTPSNPVVDRKSVV
jgi:ferric-dicitrate binding protein FerR (iron transport regulator)